MQERIQILLTGDKSVAAEFVPFARAKVNALRSLALPFIQQAYIVNGVSIRVRLSSLVGDKIYIDAPEDCKTAYDSGAYSAWIPIKSSTGEWLFPDSEAVKWVSKYKLDAYGNYVTNAANQKQIETTGIWGLNSKANPIKHNGSQIGKNCGVGDFVPNKSAIINESVFLDAFKASKFTGTMRKVVQLLLGQGYAALQSQNLAGGSPDSPTFIFNYKFNECHGIFISSTDEWWPIKISGGKVYRRKAAWCIKKHKTRTDLRTFVSYIDKDWTQIGTTGNFLNYEAVFDSCGWAFSPNGHEAQNVAMETVNTGTFGVYWYVGHRYLLTISESNGIPSVASATDIESGYVWNADKVSSGYGHMQVPVDSLKGCVTFDYNFGHFVEPPGPATGPMYVYYADDGDAVVVNCSRQIFSDAGTGGTVTDPANVTVTYSYYSGGVVSGNYIGLFKGSAASPRSAVEGDTSSNIGAVTASSDGIVCTRWGFRPIQNGQGATSRAYNSVGAVGEIISTGINVSVSYSNVNTFGDDTNVPSGFCDPVNVNINIQANRQSYPKAVQILGHSETVGEQKTQTDCFACIPYGERQAIILAAAVQTQAYTYADTVTSKVGYLHSYQTTCTGEWAVDQACYSDAGDTSPFVTDALTVHCGELVPASRTLWEWPYSFSLGAMSATIGGRAYTVNNPTAKVNGLVSVASGAGDSYTQLTFTGTSNPNPHRIKNTFGTAAQAFPTVSSSINVAYPQVNTFVGCIVGANGDSVTFSNSDSAIWATAAAKVYDNTLALGVRASFDAFDAAHKSMYSRLPNTYPTVTYPGVTEYSTLGVFGFVGYED